MDYGKSGNPKSAKDSHHALDVPRRGAPKAKPTEAEKKAAALPPKLTVPMILFFLPVLFIVILGPAAIRVMSLH